MAKRVAPDLRSALRSDSAFGLGMTGVEAGFLVLIINMSFPPGEGADGLGASVSRFAMVGLALVLIRTLRLALSGESDEPASVSDPVSDPVSEPVPDSSSEAAAKAVAADDLCAEAGPNTEADRALSEGSEEGESAKGALSDSPVWLLDTSAIIDGRIEALLGAGLMAGRLRVPRAVTRELHGLADDGRKSPRERGRRGLEVLGRMRERFGAAFDDADAKDDGGPVDEQLLALVRAGVGRLVTADVPLAGRVAGEGLPVLDLRGLAKTMVGSVSSGDRLRVTITKSGEKRGQGTASLADGAMVVVEGGGPYIGEEVEVEVMSSIRRRNGPLYFARIIGFGPEDAGDEDAGDEDDRDLGGRDEDDRDERDEDSQGSSAGEDRRERSSNDEGEAPAVTEGGA